MANFLPWWEQHPERLEHERLALQSLGIVVHEDAAARREGIVRWTFNTPDDYTGRGDVELVATFPQFYPFLRPDVTAPELNMGHHQHPFGKNLCLVGRASASWNTGDTLAWLIREQLRKALELGHSTERGGDEEDQGEPFSDYYDYSPNAMALVDSGWAPSTGMTAGSVSLRVVGRNPLQPGSHNLFLVSAITDSTGAPLFTMPEPVVRQYQAYTQVPARWTHLDAPVKTWDPADFWDAVRATDTPYTTAAGLDGKDYIFRLVSFPEEHSSTGTGTGWVLLVEQLGRLKQTRKSGHPGRGQSRAASSFHLVRAGRIGQGDMRARIASLSRLSSQKVLLIGAGAIGSVIADQLARAGIEALTVIDHDVLEPGNLVRHANNLSHVGLAKSQAAASLAIQANPYLDARPHVLPVGSVAGGASQREVLSAEYERADLVIDATAEVGVQRLTAFLAREVGKPWIGAWATNGARGGAVVHVPAAASWCFACFEWTRNDDKRLSPPVGTEQMTQPIGCAEPTFVGAGYDLSEVSGHTVRTAVAVLRKETTHDVAVLSLDHPTGADLPQWQPFSISKHPSCAHA